MMTFRSVAFAALGLMGVLGFTSGAVAQETEIPVKDVPKAVLDSAKAKFPTATIKEASKETEDGKTVYELEMTNEGRGLDATFAEDGTLIVAEAEVKESEVPAAASKAVKDAYPGAKIDLIESVKKGDKVKKEADYYEFHLTTGDKKSVEVEVDAKGKILKKAEDKD